LKSKTGFCDIIFLHLNININKQNINPNDTFILRCLSRNYNTFQIQILLNTNEAGFGIAVLL